MGFQRTVNIQPGVAQAGDFASANLRTSVLAGPGGFVAAPPPRSPVIGNFAWGCQSAALVDLGNLDVHGNAGVGATEGQLAFSVFQGDAFCEIGFVARQANAAIITNYLDETTNAIQAGGLVTLHSTGDFFAKFAAGATVGQKVFALYADGSCVAAAAGTSTQVASVTAALANTGVLTVSAVGSGAIAVGNVGTDAAGNSYAITKQLTGTVGGTGTYQTTLTGVTQGSGTVTFADRVETAFYVDSPAAAGELAKITTWG
jgi:hypothetical protein